MLTFLNLVFLKILPLATQFKATPPARDKFGVRVHLYKYFKPCINVFHRNIEALQQHHMFFVIFSSFFLLFPNIDRNFFETLLFR